VRARASLVRIGSRLRCQIHALLAEQGVHPPVERLFGPAGRRFLADLELPTVTRGRIDAALRLIDAGAAEVTIANRELRTAFAGDARIPKLLPIPGIGFTSACTVLAEIGEIERFDSPDQLCSWAGLTPTERSSDAHTQRGHISKQGSRWLRWVMVEAAVSAVRNPSLRLLQERIARRRGTKIARVALARRLLTLSFYALRDNDGCRAFLVRARTRQIRPGALAQSHGLPEWTAAETD
jgi:transposase